MIPADVPDSEKLLFLTPLLIPLAALVVGVVIVNRALFPRPGRGERPSLIVALILCAPGAAAFAAYFSDRLGDGNLPAAIGSIIGCIFWPLWFVAVLTAIVSVVLYARHPLRALPWYVVVNLGINITGLLFSGFIIVMIL